jgi:hypothetical protein
MHPAHFPGHPHDHPGGRIDLVRSLSADQRIDLKVRCIFQRQRLPFQRRFGPLQAVPFHVAGHDRGIAAKPPRNLGHAAPAEMQQPHRPTVPFGDVSSSCSLRHARSVAPGETGWIEIGFVSSRKTRSVSPGPSIHGRCLRLGPGYLLRKFRDDRVEEGRLILHRLRGRIVIAASSFDFAQDESVLKKRSC